MPLSASHIEELKEQLIADGELLGQHVRDTLGHGADAHGDTGDCSASLAGTELAFGLEEHEHSLLQEIEGALERIKSGTYGICQECGEEIPFARLKAIPTALRTADCQEKLDRDKDGGFMSGRTPVFARR